jgi:hypothetical protein
MFRKLRKTAVILSAVLPLAGGVAVRADQFDLNNYVTPSPAAQPPAVALGGLTPQSLETLVASMGYDYSTNDNTLGEHDYTLNIARAGWDFHIRVAISKDRKNLWFSTSLGKIGEGSSTAALIKLLEKNGSISPAFFTYHADNQKLYLDMPMHNEFITAKVLNQRLEEFLTTVTETSSLWDGPELKAQTASASAFGR